MQNSFILSNLSFDFHNNLRKEEDSVFYVRNGDTSDFTNTEQSLFVQNANSNSLCVKFPENYEYKGHVKLDLDEYLICLYDGIRSSIQIFNQELCTLTEILTDTCLDFKDQVYGEFKYNSGHRTVYLSNKDFIRVINLSSIPRIEFNVCSDCNNITSDRLSCEDIKVYKNFTPPNITVDITNGNIPDGVYQFAISRTDGSDNDDWFVFTKRYNLHGLNGESDRFGFTAKLDCLDYKGEFKLALIAHREDRGTVAQEIGIFPTTTKQISITELDTTYYQPISNEQLLNTTPVYLGAEFISTNTEHLVLGGMVERADINYQSQANKIKSEVGVFKVAAKDAHKYPSFQSNEVYAFEIQGVYKDGQTTNWFHIPNEHVPDNTWFQEIDPATNTDVWTDTCNVETKLKWEVYNSATLTEIIESNDNGSIGVIIPDNPNCKEYKITTNSKFWQGTLIYTDCEGNIITLENIYPTITFCSIDFASISWTFNPFDKNKDLEQISERGKCTGDFVGLDCTKYKLSDRFNSYGQTNLGTVTYDVCSIDIAGVQTCGVPFTYTGELSDYEFCTCYTTTIYDFNITVIPSAFTIDLVGDCGGGSGASIRTGSCDFALVAKSTFAYYESDIKYPNTGFEDLTNFKSCQTGIRYHKFPDRTQTLGVSKFPHIHSTTAVDNSKEFVYIMAPRFYDILPFVDCKGDVVSDIIGYRIGYKSRDNNKSILHSGLLYNMREEKLADCTPSYYANYPFNDLKPDKFIGTYELLKADALNPRKPVGRFAPQTAYKKDKFQYISPDIQFQKHDQAATELITLREENGYISGEFSNTDEIPKVVVMSDLMYAVLGKLITLAFALDITPFISAPFTVTDFAITLPETFHKLLAGKNYAYNCVLRSNYTRSNSNNIIQGNRRRQIKDSFFLQPIRQANEGLKINNYQRESGLFLNLNSDLSDPFVADNSRFTYGDIKNLSFNDIDQTNLKSSSYYVQLKKENKTQYGGLNDGLVRTLSDLIPVTNGNSGYLIGGDIYITKHKFVKKFPFFTKVPLNAPFDSPYVLSDSINVGYPKYWIDVVDRNELFNIITKSPVARVFGRIFGFTSNNFYLEPVNNPAKRNCDQGEKSSSQFGLINGMYYTHVIGVCEYYCESEYIGGYREINEVPQSNYTKDLIQYKEYNTLLYSERFLYNQQQRYKGIFDKHKHFDLTKDCCTNCNGFNYSNDRVIFSLKNDPLSKTDKWTKFLANNYHQFSQQDGEMRSMSAINNYNLLFLFDNAAYVTQTDEGLLTKNGAVYLGTGSIFERRMRKISSEINGLGGSIDRMSVINTPYGTYWADRNRKTFIYFDGNHITEINTPLKSFFLQWNDKDIIGSYDSFSHNIYWSNGDWTISYKPEAKRWISYHDWIPENFISSNNNLFSIKNGGVWKHNVKDHYQTYYGTLHPFEVGFTINNKFKQTILESVSIYAEFIKNLAWGQKEYTDKFFNKVFMYSDRISTGIKPLERKTGNSFQYKKESNIEYTVLEDRYQINGFKNFLEKTPNLEWNNYKYKVLNTLENPVDENNHRLMAKWFNLHLISDDLPEVKKIVELVVTQEKDILK